MLEQITTPIMFSYLLVFCRVGAAMMLLPGLSEGYMQPRARLIAALGLSAVIIPLMQASLPALPASAAEFSLIIAKEVLIGAFIGTIAKVLFSALHTAGLIIATQTGLSAAMLFDPTQGEQGSVMGVFLMFMGLMMIFAGDFHHLFIRAIVDSYSLFPPLSVLPTGGFADLVTKALAGGFAVAVKISAPIIVLAMVIYLGGGILGRLMPQVQVFFIMLPVQIILGFSLLMLVFSTGLLWFMQYYEEMMGNFLR